MITIPGRTYAAHSALCVISRQTINNTASAKGSDVPEQIDVHHGPPVIQAFKRVALYPNCSIIEQHGNLKTRIKGVGTGKAPRRGKGGREIFPFSSLELKKVGGKGKGEGEWWW